MQTECKSPANWGWAEWAQTGDTERESNVKMGRAYICYQSYIRLAGVKRAGHFLWTGGEMNAAARLHFNKNQSGYPGPTRNVQWSQAFRPQKAWHRRAFICAASDSMEASHMSITESVRSSRGPSATFLPKDQAKPKSTPKLVPLSYGAARTYEAGEAQAQLNPQSCRSSLTQVRLQAIKEGDAVYDLCKLKASYRWPD